MNRRKVKRAELKVGTLNVGTMMGERRELADVMERRKVDDLCIQETWREGEKARCISKRCKQWYNGDNSKRNSVRIVLMKDVMDRTVEVQRTSDKLMSLKLKADRILINIVSAYTPQVGCKKRRWKHLGPTWKKLWKKSEEICCLWWGRTYMLMCGKETPRMRK